MPLRQGNTPEVLAHNVTQLEREGWPKYQAEAIAINTAKKWAIDYLRETRADLAHSVHLDAHRRKNTVSMVRMFRKAGITQKRRKLPKQIYPHMIEQEYAAAIVGLIQRSRPLIAHIINHLPPLLVSAKAMRTDADEGRRARLLAEQAREQMRHAIPTTEIEKLATKFAERTSTHQKEQLTRQVRAAFGVNVHSIDKVGPMLGHFAAENTSLIRSIPERFHDELEKLITRGVTDGTLHTEIASDIEKQFGVAENQARLIARDQVGKLYGQINASRQKALGVTRFIWRTVGDERVREEHDDRETESEGEPYSYDDPPDGELPGEPILCRCSAEPVFDDILDEI